MSSIRRDPGMSMLTLKKAFLWSIWRPCAHRHAPTGSRIGASCRQTHRRVHERRMWTQMVWHTWQPACLSWSCMLSCGSISNIDLSPLSLPPPHHCPSDLHFLTVNFYSQPQSFVAIGFSWLSFFVFCLFLWLKQDLGYFLTSLGKVSLSHLNIFHGLCFKYLRQLLVDSQVIFLDAVRLDFKEVRGKFLRGNLVIPFWHGYKMHHFNHF